MLALTTYYDADQAHVLSGWSSYKFHQVLRAFSLAD